METKPDSQPQFPPEWLVEEFRGLLSERAKRDQRGDSSYANNVRFEANVWDLKLVFGSLVQRLGNSDIDWHTAINIPWELAKLMDYYLRVNIAFRERDHGSLTVPSGMVPKPNPPAEDDPKASEFYEMLSKIHKDVFG
jgi:hypothetical protein